MKRLLTIAALLALPAAATPLFPSVITTELSLPKEPGCELCHQGGITSSTTVTVPFGVTMKANGVKKNDSESVKAAIATITAQKTDSDGDGLDDIAELKAGTDPNKATAAVADGGTLGDGGPEVDDTVRYGCFAQSAPQFGLSFGPALVALLALRCRRS